jgi:hypothetical protein
MPEFEFRTAPVRRRRQQPALTVLRGGRTFLRLPGIYDTTRGKIRRLGDLQSGSPSTPPSTTWPDVRPRPLAPRLRARAFLFPSGTSPIATVRSKRTLKFVGAKDTLLKVIIRNIDTKLYLNSGDWIAEIGQAHNFVSSDKAIRYAIAQRLKNVEIIYAFAEERYNFSTGRMTSGEKSRSPATT